MSVERPPVQKVVVATVSQVESDVLLTAELQCVNAVLEQHGLPMHVEPTLTSRQPSRCCLRDVPVQWLAALQRVASHVACGLPGLPKPRAVLEGGSDPGEEDSDDDDAGVQDEALSLGWHLISHATEGYYVPIPMPAAPLFDTQGRVLGGWVGSVHRLMDELQLLSVHLGVRFSPLPGRVRRGGGVDLSEESLRSLQRDAQALQAVLEGRVPGHGAELHAVEGGASAEAGGEPHVVERLAWFALFEAASESLRTGSAVVMR